MIGRSSYQGPLIGRLRGFGATQGRSFYQGPMIGRLRGLGAPMPTLTGPQYAALTAAQQQAYSNADPNFMAAGTAGYVSAAPGAATANYGNNPLDYQPAQLLSMATTPTETTQAYTPLQYNAQTGGPAYYPAQTLEGWLAGFAQQQLAIPGQYPSNPLATLMSAAQSRCQTIITPDCANLTSLVNQYAGYVSQALSAAKAGGPPTSGPAGPATSVQAQPQPTSITPSTSSLMPARGSGLPPPPRIVNPSPPSLPTATGSNAASAGSVTSIANGTAMQTCYDANNNPIPCPAGYAAGTCFDVNGNPVNCQTGAATTGDIIAGIPNPVLLIGGAAAVILIAVLAGGK